MSELVKTMIPGLLKYLAKPAQYILWPSCELRVRGRRGRGAGGDSIAEREERHPREG